MRVAGGCAVCLERYEGSKAIIQPPPPPRTLRCPTCFIFVDRDKNSCCNMLAAYWSKRLGHKRPVYLRPQNQHEAPFGVGRAVRRPTAYTRCDPPVTDLGT